MNDKLLLMIALFTTSFLVLASSDSLAIHDRMKVTPYGDYCLRVSHYGKHKSIIDIKHAEEALNHYYGGKGLSVEILSKNGRFIKANVKKGDNVVDTVLFDRRTGRVRSVY